MGPRVPFVSSPFGALSPSKVVETETETSFQQETIIVNRSPIKEP